MSKLLDRLNNLNKASLPAMGFRSAMADDNARSMLIIVALPAKTETGIQELTESGVDAILLDSSGLSSAILSKIGKTRGKVLLGLTLGVSGRTVTGLKLISDEIDFVVYGSDLPVNSFESEEMEEVGKIIKVDQKKDASMLRAIHSMRAQVNAVAIDLEVAILTIEDLMNCRRVAEYTGQHIIAQVNKILTITELVALRDSGVKAVILPQDCTYEEIKDFASKIMELPKPANNRNERKSFALLPKMGLQTYESEHEEGDDDEEDDDE
jgi:hypothetical protein